MVNHTDDSPNAHWPRYLYLPDGRLMRWLHRPADDHVDGFSLTVNDDIGLGPIADELGRQLLAEHYRQPNRDLQGPIVEPRPTRHRRRPHRARRW